MKQQNPQLARWNSQNKALGPPNRWTDWTRALRGKFERSRLRRSGLELTLLQPRGPVCLQYHRWQTGTWNLAPRIELAISPLLEKTFWHSKVQGAALVDRHGSMRPMLTKEVSERPATIRGVLVPQLPSSQTSWQKGGDLQRTGGTAWDARAPLTRVFAQSRGERSERDRFVSAGENRSWELRQEALALRVVRNYMRVEELAHRTLVSACPPVASVAKNIEHRESVIEAAPVSRIGVRGRMGMDPSNFDIESLTDRVVRQLDGRLIAHKERLGRLF